MESMTGRRSKTASDESITSGRTRLSRLKPRLRRQAGTLSHEERIICVLSRRVSGGEVLGMMLAAVMETPRRLLKSWAIPPARRPMASIFWARITRSRASSMAREARLASLTSTKMANRVTRPSWRSNRPNDPRP